MRRAVEPRERARAAEKLCSRLTACEFFESAQHIAAYFPNDGEIDTWPVIHDAWFAGKSVYLPVVLPNGTLGFAPLTKTTLLENNRYGIPEPGHSAKDLRKPTELDLVLVPLVAFDDTLFRLGMGGGYYDKSFGFVAEKNRPQLVGIGYEFQCVESVLAEKWDVPAWRIVTDKAIHKKACQE